MNRLKKGATFLLIVLPGTSVFRAHLVFSRRHWSAILAGIALASSNLVQAVDCPAGPVSVAGNQCTVLPGSTITVTAPAIPGLNASGTGGNIVADGITVNLGPGALPRNFIGAQAQGPGTISFNGSSITTAQAGTGQRGLVADGVGSLISATGATITLGIGTTTASDLLGVVAQNGGSVSLTNSSVATRGGVNGLANHGLQAAGPGSQITFNGGSISALARGSYAALADSGAVVTLLNGAQLSTIGAQINAGSLGSHVVTARGSGSQINANAVSMSATGTFANGARAEAGGVVNLVNSAITTSGGGSKAVTGIQNAGALAIAGGSVQVTANTTVTTSGNYNHAVMTQNAGSRATVSDATLTTNGDFGTGLRMLEGDATLTNTNIATSAVGASAIWAQGPAATLRISGGQFTTQGSSAIGVRSGIGMDTSVVNTSIITNGSDSVGFNVGESIFEASDFSIVTNGNNNAMGVISEVDGLVTLNRGTVTTTGSMVRDGARPHALAARGVDASLIANGTIARVQGNDGMGAVADDGGSVQLNVDAFSGAGVSIRTEGLRSIGLFSVVEQSGPQFLADITTNSATIETVGSNAHGALAQQNFLVAPATINLNKTSVITRGNDSVGLRAVSAGTVVANNSTVLTQGTASHGALARDAQGTVRSSVILNQSSVTTSGADAHGAVAQAGGLISGNAANVTASGAGASALYAMGATGFVSNADFSNSTLRNTSGATVAVGGVADIALTDTTVEGSGQWLRVATADSFAPLPQPSAPITGVPELPEFDEVAGPPPTPLPPPAAIATNVPGLANIVASNATLIGSAMTDAGSVSNLTLTNNSIWRMTGDSNLTNLVNDPSLIDFSAPVGGVFKTLTVNTYSGDGAIALHTFLEGDGSPSDRLVIDGGTATALATGNTALLIRNARDASGVLGRGALTNGNGILVVDTANGGTTTADAFRLGGRAIAGPYEYTLQRASLDASNGEAWYLRSSAEPTPPSPPAPPTPTPPDPPTPTPPTPPEPPTPTPPEPPAPTPPVPNFRAETSLYGAIPAMALVYTRGLVDTLHERVAEERRLPTDPLPKEHEEAHGPSLGWGRMIFRNGERESGHDGPFGDSPAYNYDMQAFQVGLDLYRGEDTDGSHDQAGLSLAVGKIDGGVEHYSGVGAGNNVLRAYSVGGYWTHFSPEGAYVDGVLQLHHFDIEAKPGDIDELDTKGWGYTASLETGYPLLIDEGEGADKHENLYLEPQAQVIYSHVDLDDSDDIAADVRFRDVDSLIGRLGVRLAKDWLRETDSGETLRTNGWLRPSVWHEFKGQPKTEFSSADGFVPFESDIGGSWWEANLGVDYQADKKVTFYISAGYQKSFDGDSHSYEGMLGVKYDF
jgi:outer membrane autotransporter protein